MSSSPHALDQDDNDHVKGSEHNGDDSNAIASTSTSTSYISQPKRSSTLPIPSSSSSSPIPKPPRLRSRNSTYSSFKYTSDLAPVMSRENSQEGTVQMQHDDPAGVMNYLSKSLDTHEGPSRKGRKASKSVSGSRPSVVVTPAKNQSYYTTPTISPAFLASPHSPSSPEVNTHPSLKRRTSTPILVRRNTIVRDDVTEEEEQASSADSKGKGRSTDSRARSTSTSIVFPQNRDLTSAPVYSDTISSAPPQSISSQQTYPPTPSQPWNGFKVIPPTPDIPVIPPERERETERSTSWLTSAYNIGESSLIRLADWARPSPHRYHAARRGSDEDSEKGLNGSDDETVESEDRESQEAIGRNGQYWGLGMGDHLDQDPEYFGRTLRHGTDSRPTSIDFSHALLQSGFTPETLPTPASSTTSLSRDSSKRNKLRRAFKKCALPEPGNTPGRNGWLKTVFGVWTGSGGGKTGEVLRELGWTVGGLVGTFFVTLALVLWLIRGLPITTLKHIPQSTTDLQLLSAEIRAYMSSSEAGWWHTVGVIVIVGCWKHAWSVPGAVVLNILVGSLLDPMPALGLLTIITASGSLGAYLLSRPLAPLIAVLFPKPLALVRAALAPTSVPAPTSTAAVEGETITPIQASSDPSAPPIGGPEEKANVWRRLLIMRAMGFVPWSGMNVACGVVGVDWKIFWLTTAAGSASWSYVTASVGHILSRLKVPATALAAASSSVDAEEILHSGESLTSLLRDPILIAKLVFLSALTLLPVILKRRSKPTLRIDDTPLSSSSFEMTSPIEGPGRGQGTRPIPASVSALKLELETASPPMSPLSQSLATFTPTPRAFDLSSFGRTAIRQGVNVVVGSVRGLERIVRG